MTPWLDDGDVRLFHGDALEVLAELPDGSVDCVVTSPPYWGLRDYGTGQWDGGDHDCDHIQNRRENDLDSLTAKSQHGTARDSLAGRDTCRKCGATRVDQQMGLEPTPDLFVTNMVAVFREVRRVLADHGTCWVNLGDSYVSQPSGSKTIESKLNKSGLHFSRATLNDAHTRARLDQANAVREQWREPPGLKQKELVGIPWRVAFALQADGWYLRSDIIWSKPNPMPESVTDRPTKSHEYVFLLTKQPRYWFDAEAVREPADRAGETIKGDYGERSLDQGVNGGWLKGGIVAAGRNVRTVWNIATQPYPEAHFATFPEELARRCILAGCAIRVCVVCGKPSERIVEREAQRTGNGRGGWDHGWEGTPRATLRTATVGWSDCGHNNWRPGLTLDPFIGSGTVAKVARDHGRHAIGIDLSSDYLELAARRLQQLSLLTYEPPVVVAPSRGLTGGAYSPPGQSPHSNARKPKA